MPPGKTVIHAALDARDIDKDVPADTALVGDAKLTLEAMLAELEGRPGLSRSTRNGAAAEIAQAKGTWLARWLPKLTSEATPLSPYRILHDLMHTVDPANVVITHDAGSPLDQLTLFRRQPPR